MNGAPDHAREDAAAARLEQALAAVGSPHEAAELLFDAVHDAVDVDAVTLALVDEEGKWATGFASRGTDEAWWSGITMDLQHGSSGIATAARERVAFAVFDVESAPNLSRRLADTIGAKSAAFVPLLADRHLVGVVVAATTRAKRFFVPAELDLLQQLGNVAAVAIEQTHSTDELRRALERERLVAQIARRVRSELDLDDVLQVAVEETGRALHVERCFVRLGAEEGEPMAVRAQWTREGVEPLTLSPDRLPVSNLALRGRRTVPVGDVATAPELEDESLGGRDALAGIGSRAVLATPIEIFDEVIGVFALHRAEPHTWSSNDISVAEAIAGEVGLAIHTARLLAEDERRLDQQAALLNAAQVVTSDLRLESVLERLVHEVALLFRADAADCWTFEADGATLRCRAVVGLPEEEELGRRLTPEGTFANAIRSGKPVLQRDFARTESPPPSKNFADFEEVMVAPITWLGEVRGVLGVCSREHGRFQGSELEVLDAFARFASLAAHNAESFEERERQAQIQQGFYRIAEVLGSPLSLAETLDALAQAAAEALGGDSAVVLERRGGLLCLAGAHEVPASLHERLSEGLPAEATPFPGAAREERIISSTGLADDERFDDATRALLREHGYEALLCAPVQRSAENAAAVVLFRSERTFSDDDLALARHLSGAARGALERSDLYEQERHARGLSQRLATLGARLVTNLDPALVLEEVAREAAGLVDGDAAVLRLLQGEHLVVQAASGPGTGALRGSRSSSGAGLLGEVTQSRQPTAVDDVSEAPQRGRGDPLLGGQMAATVVVPVAGQAGQLYGTLSVYARERRAWRPDEVQALVALGAMTSAALANAELYQRVAEEKERSDAILGNIADGIVAVDRDGRIVLWNTMAERITGVPAMEALGRRVVEALQRELASEGEDSGGERQVAIVRAGKEVWLSLTEALMRDAAGAVTGRIFAFRDVSGERAVEQMKSDFVAAVSHELRTPLTSIYGFAETLQREDVDFGEEDRAAFLSYIASESERLTAIVDDLLSVARLDAGTLGVTLVPTDVGQVVQEAVERFSSSVNGSHEFVVELPEGSLEAAADSARLSEVVAHLVDNAVKYSPDGGRIVVSGRRKSDAVEVRVSDEGLGIPHADQPRIFVKFFRGEPAAGASAQGTGIGLFLARGLLAAMNGRIWVESEEGKGSSFVFELPVSNVA